MAWRELHDQDTSISDEDYACADPVRQVFQIHFYDYNGTWQLDVAIKETGIISITEKDIRMLHDLFNCHDCDEDLARLNTLGIPENERPLLFYFAINKVLSSSR